MVTTEQDEEYRCENCGDVLPPSCRNGEYFCIKDGGFHTNFMDIAMDWLIKKDIVVFVKEESFDHSSLHTKNFPSRASL